MSFPDFSPGPLFVVQVADWLLKWLVVGEEWLTNQPILNGLGYLCVFLIVA